MKGSEQSGIVRARSATLAVGLQAGLVLRVAFDRLGEFKKNGSQIRRSLT
jgi:hypothetical protein